MITCQTAMSQINGENNYGNTLIIKGNREIETKTFNVDNFNSISCSGKVELFINSGPTQSVKLKCETNIMKHIKISSNNKELSISNQSNSDKYSYIKQTVPIHIYITIPYLNNISLSGACNARLDNMVYGENVQFAIMGVSNINCDNINTKQCTLLTSGAGNIFVNKINCTEEFNVTTAGSSNITINKVQQPENSIISIVGTGSIYIDSLQSDNIKNTVAGTGSLDIDISNCTSLLSVIAGTGNSNISGNCDQAIFNIGGTGSINAKNLKYNSNDFSINGTGSIYVTKDNKIEKITYHSISNEINSFDQNNHYQNDSINISINNDDYDDDYKIDNDDYTFQYYSSDDKFNTKATIIKGDNNVVSEARKSPEQFDAVKLFIDANVYITYGAEATINIRGEKNILKYISTDINNGTLTIDKIYDRQLYNAKTFLLECHSNLEIFITIPVISSLSIINNGNYIINNAIFSNDVNISISGKGNIKCYSLNTDNCKLETEGYGKINITNIQCNQIISNIEGAGNYNLAGKCNNATLMISGTGRINAEQLKYDVCRATIEGTGIINAQKGNITKEIEGIGRINLK